MRISLFLSVLLSVGNFACLVPSGFGIDLKHTDMMGEATELCISAPEARCVTLKETHQRPRFGHMINWDDESENNVGVWAGRPEAERAALVFSPEIFFSQMITTASSQTGSRLYRLGLIVRREAGVIPALPAWEQKGREDYSSGWKPHLGKLWLALANPSSPSQSQRQLP